MNEFKVLRTNHTSFTVSDLERACAFFESALGFEIVSKAPRDPDLIQRIDVLSCFKPVQLRPSREGHIGYSRQYP